MSAQSITPELKAWIVAQAQAGQPPEALLKAMQASGWAEEVALRALETTLREHLPPGIEFPSVPAASPVPDIAPGTRAGSIRAGGRDVQVLAAMQNPRILVFANLLSAEECESMIARAKERLTRSETVQTETGSSEVNDARTSEGMFFERGEFEVCARLEARIAELLSWPVENGEGLQVLRYGPGAEYKPHHDYFDTDRPGTPAIVKRGGQRVASVVCYLNTPERGGATVFPDVGFEVAPIQGNAVFFSYDRPHPSTRSLHGGAPVVEGEKWVATKWLREGRFD